MRGKWLFQLAQDQRQRFGAVGEQDIRDSAHGCDRDGDIDRYAGDHRSDDADLQVAVGVFGFLRRRGDGVEAVEGEEDDGSRGHYATFYPIIAHMLGKAERAEGFEIGGVQCWQCHRDEDDQCDDLDDDQQGVDRRAFPCACQQHRGNHGDDENGGQVDDAAQFRPLHQRHRYAEIGIEQRCCIA